MKMFFKKLIGSFLFLGIYYFVFWIFGSIIQTIFRFDLETTRYSFFVALITVVPLIVVIMLIALTRLKNNADAKCDYITIIENAEKWCFFDDTKITLKSRSFWFGIVTGGLAVTAIFIPNIAKSQGGLFFGIFLYFVVLVICFVINLPMWLIVYKLWRNNWMKTLRLQEHSIKSHSELNDSQ